MTDELAARRATRDARQAEIDQVIADARALIEARDPEVEAALAELEDEYPFGSLQRRPRSVE